MLMYQKDSQEGVLVAQSQIKTLEKAGWTKKIVKVEEAPVKEAPKPTPVAKKAEQPKVATATVTPKPTTTKTDKK